ncbi:hypothetical protein N9H94_02475, partial [Akkermansiaceae bacterium]|nr:hypothetical protein [Akkermansiaceae bacterium]
GESIDDLLIPGDASKSFLMTVIKWEDDEYEMPPKENDRLDEEQIAHIETWINNGAPWPSDDVQKEIRLAERTKTVTDEGMIVRSESGGARRCGDEEGEKLHWTEGVLPWLGNLSG